MSYDRQFMEAVVTKFSASPPPAPKPERSVTKQALVTAVRSTIDEWRRQGHSIAAIAVHCVFRSHLSACSDGT
jgi:hypothetical protein